MLLPSLAEAKVVAATAEWRLPTMVRRSQSHGLQLYAHATHAAAVQHLARWVRSAARAIGGRG